MFPVFSKFSTTTNRRPISFSSRTPTKPTRPIIQQQQSNLSNPVDPEVERRKGTVFENSPIVIHPDLTLRKL